MRVKKCSGELKKKNGSKIEKQKSSSSNEHSGNPGQAIISVVCFDNTISLSDF